MNKYRQIAKKHWTEFRPMALAELPESEEFFSTLGEQMQAQILDLAYKLTGLRPSPTRLVAVSFRFSRKLTQGPAVRLADRRHPLRLDVLTMTRSAFLQVRCAFVAQMERAARTLHRLFGRLPAKLDSKSRLRRA